MAHAKNVFGLCVDPHNDSRIATYSDDGTVKVWDTRMLVKRNTQEAHLWFTTQTRITQIGWCPTRSGVLASCSENSPVLQLWDTNATRSSSSDKGDGDGPITLAPCQLHETPDHEPIASFDWHRRDENRILLATPSGGLQA